MKHAVRILSVLAALALLLSTASPAHARGLMGGEVVFGNTYTLESGQTQNGDVVIFGGVGLIEEGATINGALVLFGGSLSVNGAVNGDVVVFGGATTLGSSARISGDVVTLGSALQRDAGAVVSGQVITNTGSPDFEQLPPDASVPNTPQVPPAPQVSTPLREAFNPVGQALGIFFRALALGFLALLVTLFLPRQTDYISNAVVRQPVLAGGLGLLTVVVFPIVLLLLTITILLIPVAFLAALALAVAIVWGWLAIGMEVGQRLMSMLKVEWPLPVGVALGTFLLTLAVDTVGSIPCIGWIAPAMVALLGLGGVLMTSFGTRVILPPEGFIPVPGPAWERRPEPYTPAEAAPESPPPPAGRKVAASDDEPLPPTS